jgi:peptidoglycan/xylan/chitin deacetylase (PgdA/CDA1 family)
MRSFSSDDSLMSAPSTINLGSQPSLQQQDNTKYVILTFDDSQVGEYQNAKPILDRYGFKGTFFVICGKVGTTRDAMSWQQVTDLQNDGMDIESHSLTHAHLNKLSQSQLVNEIGGSKQCLANHGFNSNIFGYPFGEGSENKTVVNTVAQYYNLARSARENLWFLHCDKYAGHHQTDCRTYLPDGTLQYANRYTIRARAIDPYYDTYNFNYETVFNIFVNWVNSQTSYNQNGGVAAVPIVVFHNVLPTTGKSYVTPTSFFDRLVRYLHDNGFVTLTMKNLSYDSTNNAMYINTLTSQAQHRTTLILNPIPAVDWGQTVTVTGRLTDSDAGGVGLGGKVISFTGTGANNILSSVTTNADGTFSARGVAPKTVATNWQVTAHFAGDVRYEVSDSVLRTYSTSKHATGLGLGISPSSLSAGALYKVSGTLRDTTTSTVLGGMTISFTATSPITISSTTTDPTTGVYSVTGLRAPNTAGSYNIQASFAGNSLYKAANSPIRTLTVTSTAAATPAAVFFPFSQ